MECKIEGCNNKVSNRTTGLCHKHDLRLKRYGTTELTRQLVDHTKKCIVDGCDRQQESSIGYCKMHYKRYKRHGTTDLIVKERKKCKICGEEAVAHELCSKHYQSLRTHGDPEWVDKNYKDINSYGYKRAKHERYKVEHRLIAEKMLGRPLTKEDIVHHVDLDKLNNEEYNLYICNKSEHTKLHKQLEQCAAELFKFGYIIFDNGKYIINSKIINNTNLK